MSCGFSELTPARRQKRQVTWHVSEKLLGRSTRRQALQKTWTHPDTAEKSKSFRPRAENDENIGASKSCVEITLLTELCPYHQVRNVNDIMYRISSEVAV